MNLLNRKRRAKLKKAFAMGLSLSEAAAYAGCARGTANRYRARLPWNCPCGKGWSEHHGWCSERYKRSPARQAFIRRWKEGLAKATDKA